MIWDQSPVGQTKEFARPQALVKAETAWNAEPLDGGGLLGSILNMFNRGAAPDGPSEQRVYFGLKQPMQMVRPFQIPTEFNLEWAEFATAMSEKTGGEIDDHTLGDIFLDAEIAYEYRAAFQLLGLPAPEQDDPRYDAAMVVHRGAGLAMSDGHVANEELLVTEAKSWRLLFQASLPNWWQEEFTEGTVYFLIRDDDLTARDFDNIVAVYQQT